ncbi:hypothetical protein C5167_035610 [Papaver somniferum]|uniref:Uncharacterized protein n=1 Tax=Papaver somniferum TaxID=3469 RepID=A0A4Y7KHF5_PAPSO|nr:hypothetical protein C5167_035610 [Papaver somniferum]
MDVILQAKSETGKTVVSVLLTVKQIERVAGHVVLILCSHDIVGLPGRKVWQSRSIWYERACNLICHFMSGFKRGLRFRGGSNVGVEQNSEWRVVAVRK